MIVEQWMSRGVQACLGDDTLEHVAGLLWSNDIGTIVVVDAGHRPIGMITDRDVCMAAYTQGRRLSEIHVSSAMSRTLHSCRSGDALLDAERTMRREQVRRLPVVDADGRAIGVLSLNDLARAARCEDEGAPEGQEVLDTLCDVSQPHGMQMTDTLEPKAPTPRTKPSPARASDATRQATRT